MIKIILKTVLLLLCGWLWQSPNVWGLAPKTCLNQETRFEPFEVSLKKALQAGLFQEIFQTKEKLEVISVIERGDPHFYIQIDNIEIVRDLQSYFQEENFYGKKVAGAIVDLTYLIQDKEGYGVGEKETYLIMIEFLPSGEVDWKKLYREIDDRVVRHAYTDWPQKKLREEFFSTTSVKKIIFKGQQSNKEYEIYYKFWKTSRMELFGAKMFRSLGFKVPNVYPSHNSHHVWIESIKSNFGLEKQSWKLKQKEWKELFYRLGGYSALTFVLGHDDFHEENFLLLTDKENNTYEIMVMDFETIGQAAIKGNDCGEKNSLAILRLLDCPKGKRFKPIEAFSLYTLGFNRDLEWDSIFKELEKYDENLFMRVVLRGTGEYKEAGIVPVPHYCHILKKEPFQDLVLRRYKRWVKTSLREELASVFEISL